MFDTSNIMIDTQNPHMLNIGDNVRLTRGVIILTHDYSWSVIAGKYGECLGGVGYVDIGSNVFIGMNSIILKNTTIGDNVIIGAGSVVNGKIDNDSVYAGVPAKRIMSIDDYYKKCIERQEQDADEILTRYYEKYGSWPDESVLREYFWLFADRKESLESKYTGLVMRTGYGDQCMNVFANSYAIYDGYADILQSTKLKYLKS